MKRRIKKEDLVVFLRELDTRIEDKSEAWIDRAINSGFAELGTVTNQFTMETSIDLLPYYENGETKLTINLSQDVNYVFDMYLMVDSQNPDLYKHGERKIRDENLIYSDAQDISSINVDLKGSNNYYIDTFTAAVVKYFYTPNADFDDIYIGGDVYLALENALAAAAYQMLHDVEKNGQMRAAMTRTGLAILTQDPEDYQDLVRYPAIFPSGV